MAREQGRDTIVTKNSHKCHNRLPRRADVSGGSQRPLAQSGDDLREDWQWEPTRFEAGGGGRRPRPPASPRPAPKHGTLPKDESDNIHYGTRPP
jgi:hypothetical protein